MPQVLRLDVLPTVGWETYRLPNDWTYDLVRRGLALYHYAFQVWMWIDLVTQSTVDFVDWTEGMWYHALMGVVTHPLDDAEANVRFTWWKDVRETTYEHIQWPFLRSAILWELNEFYDRIFPVLE